MWWMWWKIMASTLHKESSACQVMSLKCLCWQMHYSWHPMSCSVDCDVRTWQLSTKSNLFLTRYTLECVWWKNSPKRLEFKKDLKTMARHGPFGTPCCDARLQYFRWPQPRISTHSHQRPSVWGKFYTGQYYATGGWLLPLCAAGYWQLSPHAVLQVLPRLKCSARWRWPASGYVRGSLRRHSPHLLLTPTAISKEILIVLDIGVVCYFLLHLEVAGDPILKSVFLILLNTILTHTCIKRSHVLCLTWCGLCILL